MKTPMDLHGFSQTILLFQFDSLLDYRLFKGTSLQVNFPEKIGQQSF